MIMSNDRKQFEIFTIMKKKANGNYYNILQQALKHFPTLLVYMKSIYLIYFAHMSIVCMCARFLRRIFFSRRAGSLSRGFFLQLLERIPLVRICRKRVPRYRIYMAK